MMEEEDDSDFEITQVNNNLNGEVDDGHEMDIEHPESSDEVSDSSRMSLNDEKVIQLRGGPKRKHNAPDYLDNLRVVQRTNPSVVRHTEAHRRLNDGIQSMSEWPEGLSPCLRIIFNNIAEAKSKQWRTDAHEYTAEQCPVLE